MPSILNIATSLASKGIGAATTVGGFIAGQAAERIKSLSGGRGSDDTYSPVAPAPSGRGGAAPVPATNGGGDAGRVAELQPGPAKPGGTRMAPPAPKRAAKPRAASAPKRAAKPRPASATASPKSGTSTTTKTTSRTGARSAGAQISNPKKARAVRKRLAADAEKAENTASERTAGTAGKESSPLGKEDRS